jgi:CheY-like chemotaxis protein
MVIDDNRMMADSLCQYLSLLDVRATPTYGPRAAMLAMRERLPDIVFLDINMPGVSGFEVLSYLKREPSLSKVPVVVVTAEGDAATAERAHQLGAVALIVKPATFEALEAALKAAQIIP